MYANTCEAQDTCVQEQHDVGHHMRENLLLGGRASRACIKAVHKMDQAPHTRRSMGAKLKRSYCTNEIRTKFEFEVRRREKAKSVRKHMQSPRYMRSGTT